jgi:hypothetical protein
MPQARQSRQGKAPRKGRLRKGQVLAGSKCPPDALVLVDAAYADAYDTALRAVSKALGVRLDGTSVNCDGWFDDAIKIFKSLFGPKEINKIFSKITKAASSIRSAVDETLQTVPGINARKYLQAGSKQIAAFKRANASLIVSVGPATIERMKDAIGTNPDLHSKGLEDAIRNATNVSKSRARFWAVDQTLKLHADVAQAKHESLGITEYFWRTSGDERVRHDPKRGDHEYLDGTRQAYKGPGPVVDHKTGRRAQVGRDYRCRCNADPILPS